LISTIYIGGWRLDQFNDENVNVVSQVASIKDITANNTDYTYDFTLPASQRNNILFKHWYDFNIDNGFDARTKQSGEIYLDGVLFKEGNFSLLSVNIKKNKVNHYVVKFVGKLVDIKEKAKELELSDLNLIEYDHDFSSDNVYLGLTQSLFSGSIIYNLFAKKQFYINGDGVDEVQTATTSNISFEGGAGSGVIWNDLRPSLKVINIIEAIEVLLDVTFTRHFFGTSEFNTLYMWLNPDKDETIRGNSQRVDWDNNTSPPFGNPGMFGPYMNLTTDEGSYPRELDGWWSFVYVITPEVGFETVTYTMRTILDGDDFASIEIPSGGNQIDGSGVQLINMRDVSVGSHIVSFEVVSEQDFQYTAVLNQYNYDNAGFDIDSAGTSGSAQTLNGDLIISQNIPKIKIIDFLKGLFNAFKLVIIRQENGDYYVNTISNYYAEGLSYDITKYIDWDSFDVSRGELLNEIKFKFKEPTTIANILFESLNGRGYGDQFLYLNDEDGKPLEGGSLVVELPFEQFQYERLIDVFTSIPAQLLHASIVDEDLQPANPKAHLFYNIREGQGVTSIGFRNDLDQKIPIPLPTINVPNHGNSLENSSFSFLFEAEYSEWDGNPFTKNLYKNHYEDYILAIFNIKKRTVKHKAFLPLHIITKIQLNDVVYIKGNYYRIDKYSYNLLDGATDFDLVNSFDNTLNPYLAYPNTITTSLNATTEKVFLTSASNSTFVKNDLGFGTSWVTVSGVQESQTTTNILTIDVDENTTEYERSITITSTNKATGETETIYIYQKGVIYIPTLNFSNYRNSQYLNLII
jgi:hypothetical protein